MAVNPDALSAARQPRGIVRVGASQDDGSILWTRLDAWIHWEVDNNTYSEADTFRVTFALSALPAAYNDAFWAMSLEVFVEIFAGFPADAENYGPADLKSIVYGRVDDIDYDPVDRKLTVSGRDLTAILIDARTTESFQGDTASKVALRIAARHGFTPVVTPTTDMVGNFYETDTVKVNTQRSEWDVLTQLATAEDFLVYIKGNELHFEPLPAPATNAYVLKWEPPNDKTGAFSFNGKSITFTRALHIARGIVVQVKYTMPNKKGTFVVRYPNKSAGIKVGQSKANAQLYSLFVRNISPQQALKRAEAEHASVTRHEVKMRATLPADNILQTNNIITVTGTATAFDQTYYPESIVREMDINTGYTMSISAKNHSPSTVVAI